MKTSEITKSDIAGLELLDTGYKAIKYDGGTQQDFNYCEKNENLVGRIFAVDGDIEECKWGLHYCADPAYVFNFYEPLGYNRYFKINAYGKVIKGEKKSVAQIIEFVEEFDIMEYIDIIQRYDRGSNAVSNSEAVSHSKAVSYSKAVSHSNAVSYSKAVSCSYAVSYSKAVSCSYAVSTSKAVSYSEAVSTSKAVSNSEAVSYSEAVSNSEAVSYSEAVSTSKAVSNSEAVSYSYALRNCNAAYLSAFCNGKDGISCYLFNKETTKSRAKEVVARLKSFDWQPQFTNFYEIKGNKKWWAIAFPELKNVDNKTAWSGMPPKMLEYIKSLPEFDAKLFTKITDIEV